ncbi:CRP-like cAMP-binding protein [Pedobacter psychrotolerans]|uniref:CRP-like cAMP-binding protein n=1 Tax=Pedobacter psychrotolerans TaxID=1843235 RepID=A0A4R2H5Y1_9SPHI|nr:Crp/Fnr family transcriptional regulator [Pedobacter psychrotolerans]TCO21430.1 CRP-like cAMP-binding protein [Pedobacter psychrotolerans]GGE38598.1 Crp/Fnr family transcriptional regulator [Pedobacter psychrotolerans]
MILKTFSQPGQWETFGHLFKAQTVGAKTILLDEGAVARNAFFVKSGCLRLWFNDHGRDITFQFFFEGEFVSSFESFRSGLPSTFFLESIEPSTLECISKPNFQKILAQSNDVKNEVEEQTFQRLVFYQQLFLSRIRDNPEQRYKNMLTQYPKILQRVPQHYIASYLGITSVSLSRIRNRK